MDCCSLVLILGSACVEICRGWGHWESRVRCVGSEGRNLTARETPWEQNGLLPWLILCRLFQLNPNSDY